MLNDEIIMQSNLFRKHRTKKIKIKKIPIGSIIWTKDGIFGIKGMNQYLEKYAEAYCIKITGNKFDYELVIDKNVKIDM